MPSHLPVADGAALPPTRGSQPPRELANKVTSRRERGRFPPQPRGRREAEAGRAALRSAADSPDLPSRSPSSGPAEGERRQSGMEAGRGEPRGASLRLSAAPAPRKALPPAGPPHSLRLRGIRIYFLRSAEKPRGGSVGRGEALTRSGVGRRGDPDPGTAAHAHPSPLLRGPQPGKAAPRLEPRRLQPTPQRGVGPLAVPPPQPRADPARGGRRDPSPLPPLGAGALPRALTLPARAALKPQDFARVPVSFSGSPASPPPRLPSPASPTSFGGPGIPHRRPSPPPHPPGEPRAAGAPSGRGPARGRSCPAGHGARGTPWPPAGAGTSCRPAPAPLRPPPEGDAGARPPRGRAVAAPGERGG